jgi:hypothetical protein
MKILIATLLLPLATQAKSVPKSAAPAAKPSAAAAALVSCKVAEPAHCKDCAKRVPVSCEDNSAVGSMDLATKPAKIQWQVSNPKNGTEKILTMDNKTLSLKDLQSSKDLKALAAKQKVSVAKDENVSLAGIQVASGTAIFKAQTGTVIAVKLKPQDPQRAIASDNAGVRAGGVGRALKMKDQK